PMPAQPTLKTSRLILRPWLDDDAPIVAKYMADELIWRTTALVPHPYELHHAHDFFAMSRKNWETGVAASFAAVLRETSLLGSQNQIVGSISARITPDHKRADIGYAVYVPWWNKGICTEMLRAVISFCFDALQLNRVEAHHFANNPSSGRVMQKAGMTYEGCFRANVIKAGEVLDTHHYAILRSEYHPDLATAT
ncbi:MAG TPA: GNAT family protein, partial [Phycisphaerales bacterium]|nr:GNAT family protein [Phycisphaerales bacterium]